MSDSTTAPAGDAHDGHDPFLAHHFESQQQQFDAGKLGMWLFLVTEILFFSGLFVAYAVYRSNHPEVFIDAHKYLDKTLGALNTIVLLFSSLTMAWAVRCAQLNQRKGLIWCLTITLACASLFLGVKAVEYTHKWELGLFWGESFDPHGHIGPPGVSLAVLCMCLPATVGMAIFWLWAMLSRLESRWEKFVVAAGLTSALLAFVAGLGWCAIGLMRGESFNPQVYIGGYGISRALACLSLPAALGLVIFVLWTFFSRLMDRQPQFVTAAALTVTCLTYFVGVGIGQTVPALQERLFPAGEAASHGATHGEAAIHDTGSIETEAADAPAGERLVVSDPLAEEGRSLVSVFFSIYYSMTGIHAIHILAGMGVIVWLLRRALQGHFSESYYGPVDYVGLYWHLVDLIWIYLFPLLYLIH